MRLELYKYFMTVKYTRYFHTVQKYLTFKIPHGTFGVFGTDVPEFFFSSCVCLHNCYGGLYRCMIYVNK